MFFNFSLYIFQVHLCSKALIARDQRISPYIRKHKRKVITLQEYWISILHLQRAFDVEDRFILNYYYLPRNSGARGWSWRGRWPRLTPPAPPLAGPCPGIFLAAPPLAGHLPWLNFRDPGPGRAIAPAELLRSAPGRAFAPAKYSGPGPDGAKTSVALATPNYVLKRR